MIKIIEHIIMCSILFLDMDIGTIRIFQEEIHVLRKSNSIILSIKVWTTQSAAAGQLQAGCGLAVVVNNGIICEVSH